MGWLARINDARKRGRFTENDVADAGLLSAGLAAEAGLKAADMSAGRWADEVAFARAVARDDFGEAGRLCAGAGLCKRAVIAKTKLGMWRLIPEADAEDFYRAAYDASDDRYRETGLYAAAVGWAGLETASNLADIGAGLGFAVELRA